MSLAKITSKMAKFSLFKNVPTENKKRHAVRRVSML